MEEKMRTAEVRRRTSETNVMIRLVLDGKGESDIKTGVGFMDHMLTLFAKHGRFDLEVFCEGDTFVDDHHTTEDLGIALGTAFSEALGEKRGIRRYGSAIIPMDESLILTSVDISGRAYLGYDLDIPTEKVGTFDTELVEEFLMGFVRKAEITIHVRELAGTNSHHMIEGAFKSLARSLKKAVSLDPDNMDEIPSTKGVL